MTQVVDRRIPIFTHEPFIQLLRENLRETQKYHPFSMLAYAFLPEHFHMMIRPTDRSNFSDIMHSLKPNFTKDYKNQIHIHGSMKFWQKGFWDHVIHDEHDFERHLDYIHYNPVKHGLVERPEDWQHSSFAEWKRRGIYAARWGWSLPASIQDYNWNDSETDQDE
ncbi:MAG: transposase [Caldilineaceae bacterium]